MTTDSTEEQARNLAPVTLEFYPIMGHGGRGQKYPMPRELDLEERTAPL